MGRPSKYTPELLERAHTYLDSWREMGRTVPSLKSLALHLDIARETVNAWQKDPEKPEFSVICDRIMSEQAQELMDKGLTGEFNATIAKLMLSKHGYSDKVDNTHTFKLPKDMTEDEIRAELKERREANPL